MNDAEIFVHELARVVPPLGPLLDEHIAGYDELLPHVYMGDVSRFAIAQLRECTGGVAGACSTLQALLAFLEQGAATGTEGVKDLIGASFVENVAYETAGSREFQSMLGPALRREFHLFLDADGDSDGIGTSQEPGEVRPN